MRKDPITFASGVKVTKEPVTIYKYVFVGTVYKDGKPAGEATFSVWNGKFTYLDERGNDYDGEVVDCDKTEIEGFDYGLNVEGVEVDDEADRWECRWYDLPSHSTGGFTVIYSAVYGILVVLEH
jgi:hypothetical protein